MTCYMAGFEGTVQPSSEIQENKWLNYNDLDKIKVKSDKFIYDFKELL